MYFCHRRTSDSSGKQAYRVFGRCELAWHELPAAEAGYAGPGWFGKIGEVGTADSHWENRTLAEDLCLGREGVGTTTCVLGFHDASEDEDRKPVDLADSLLQAAAENFFPALVADKLGVRVEVYESGEQYRTRKPAFSRVANPEAYVPAAVRMLRAYREHSTVTRFGGEKHEVAARDVVLTVPKRIALATHAEQEHKAVLLVTRADEDVPVSGSEKPDHLAMFRGPGMVVEFKSLAGVCLGARPFHALLLCGRAPEFVAPTIAREVINADTVAEAFLRTAEPPAHNKWTATPELKAEYARGGKARLDAFLKAAADEVRELVRPAPRDTGDGPNALKELFQIGSERGVGVGGARSEQPRIVEQRGDVDADGRWRVTARIRLKARKTFHRITPAVYFQAETGTGTAVSWASLTAVKGCEVEGQSLLVPPDTREIRFEGGTDPKSHPIPAAESCVVVDIRRTSDVERLSP
jgi:hypothetical protein